METRLCAPRRKSAGRDAPLRRWARVGAEAPRWLGQVPRTVGGWPGAGWRRRWPGCQSASAVSTGCGCPAPKGSRSAWRQASGA